MAAFTRWRCFSSPSRKKRRRRCRASGYLASWRDPPMIHTRPSSILAALLGLLLAGFANSAVAQDTWSPFKQWPETSAPRPPKGMARPGEAVPDRTNLQPERPFGPRGNVERGELDPVMAPDNSGL